MTKTTSDVSPKLAAIRVLTAAGYVLVPLCSLEAPHNHRGKPCRTPGKVPVARDWTAVQLGDYTEEELLKGNYGIVLQKDDLIIDADPRNYANGDDPVKRLQAAVGAFPLTAVAQTGGGGFHYFFKKPVDVDTIKSHRDYQGVDFLSAGAHIVGVGSGHVSGKEYRWAPPTKSETLRPADAPAALLALIHRPTQLGDGAPGLDAGTYADDAGTRSRYLAYLQDVAKPSVMGQGGDNNAFKVACHGRDLGLSAEATFTMMFEVWNPKCAPPWDADELRDKVNHAYKYASANAGNAQPSVDFAPVDVAPVEEKKPDTSKPDFRVDNNGRLIKSFHNLLQYFKYDKTGLAGVFAFNEFRSRVEFARPAPWHGAKLPAHRGVGDNDLKLLKAHLSVNFKYETNLNVVEEAVTVAAMDNHFHPVREYLESLKWDGTPRLDFWLARHLGAADNEYTRACSRKTLCAAVMRVMRPGCKFDHVLVLEGRQGLGKSSVCSILAGEWGSDAPLDPHSKDTIQLMQGQWIIELAELRITKFADIDAIKAFVTRQKDQARLAYQRTVVEFPRQSIFIGSINPGADGTYLKDDENRRWWPVSCGGPTGETRFDLRGLKEARNQLFAEAMHLVKTRGENLDMDTPALRVAAAREAAHRHADHPWSERVAQWVADCDARIETRREFLTVRDVFIGAIGGSDKQLGRVESAAIADVLRSLGWEQTRKGVVKGWKRRAPTAAELLGDLA